MAEEDVVGGGVGGLNTGDSGINDGSAGTGGGGAGSNGSTSGSSSTEGSSDTPQVPEQSEKEKEVNEILVKYLELSAIGYGFEKVVDIYMQYKLGFGKDGETLKKRYKEEANGISDEEVDEAVAEQIEETKKALTEEGSSANEDIKKKYEEFKTASFEAKKNLAGVIVKSIKLGAEAFMPPMVGPVAPNPISVGLKLYNGLSDIKAVVDRSVIALTLFMTTAKALGINNTDGYQAFIDVMHGFLKPAIKMIADKEAEAAKNQDPDLALFVEEAKKSYTTTGLQGQPLGHKGIEDMAKNEFELYMYPLTDKELRKLYNIVNVQPSVAMIPGIGVIAAYADIFTTNDRERRAKMVIDYNSHIVTTVKAMFDARDASKDNSAGTSSGTGQSDGTFSGDTRL